MKGLLIKSPWIDLILQGKKTWEIRSSHTHIRGPVALIKSGTGMIYGEITVLGSKELTREEFESSELFHQIPIKPNAPMPYKKTHAWIVGNPVIYNNPVPYIHPQGAVIWVNLPQ